MESKGHLCELEVDYEIVNQINYENIFNNCVVKNKINNDTIFFIFSNIKKECKMLYFYINEIDFETFDFLAKNIDYYIGEKYRENFYDLDLIRIHFNYFPESIQISKNILKNNSISSFTFYDNGEFFTYNFSVYKFQKDRFCIFISQKNKNENFIFIKSEIYKKNDFCIYVTSYKTSIGTIEYHISVYFSVNKDCVVFINELIEKYLKNEVLHFNFDKIKIDIESLEYIVEMIINKNYCSVNFTIDNEHNIRKLFETTEVLFSKLYNKETNSEKYISIEW